MERPIHGACSVFFKRNDGVARKNGLYMLTDHEELALSVFSKLRKQQNIWSDIDLVFSLLTINKLYLSLISKPYFIIHCFW